MKTVSLTSRLKNCTWILPLVSSLAHPQLNLPPLPLLPPSFPLFPLLLPLFLLQTLLPKVFIAFFTTISSNIASGGRRYDRTIQGSSGGFAEQILSIFGEKVYARVWQIVGLLGSKLDE